ncbi:MAG: TonB-dependent receptor [Bacteroidetes bacterium]|nr:TonB-dependent receptor [Bacteroidota bacterium]
MKKLTASVFLLLVSFLVNAQEIIGKINGTVLSPDNKPITGATVTLLTDTGKKLVKINITDKAGVFMFENVALGKFILTITATGFEKKQVEPFEISNASLNIVLPAIMLTIQSKSLGAVTVVSSRPLIEQKPDRMIVNVDASPSNAGATAMEVLEKSPGIAVDNDGNISLKGKQGVIVMMDGKQTYLSAADLANVLKNLPASALDQIEIMTNPSSKFDAAGNSGIINIKTKKNKIKGSNGNISAGNTMSLFRNNGAEKILWKPTLTVNYNYKKNKINFFSNFVYNYREGRSKMDIVSRYYREGKQIDSINNVNTLFNFKNNNYTLKLGLDYTPDKRNTFGIVLNGFLFAGRPSPTTSTTFTNLQGTPFSRLNSVTKNKINFTNLSGNLNYKHSFDSTGTEITLDLDYANYDNSNDQLLRTGFFDGNFIQTADSMFLRGHLPSTIDIYSVKSDFVKPFKNGLKLEAGIKSSYVRSDNLVNYERKAGAGWVPDARNNHFIYAENINAVYLNANKKIKKWEIQAGLRLENTNSKGTQESNNSEVKKSYVNLFPTLFVSYPLNDKNTITASASRRLQRPNYQDLNPFTFFLDSLSYRQGNPYLTPQFSYNYELTHTYKGKLITTLNYTKTTDVISNIINRKRGANNEIIGFLTSDNIAKYSNMGLAISYQVKLSKWWSANFYGNVFRNHYLGTYISNESGAPEVVDLDLSYTSFSFNINNSFTIGKGWTAELSGFYRYRSIEQLSLSYPMGQMNIGLAKNNLLKGKASIRLNARDPFNWQSYRALTKYGTVDFNIVSRWDNRQYGATFTYRFGKQTQQRRRASATAEEQSRVGGQGN